MKQLIRCPKCEGWQYVQLISNTVYYSPVTEQHNTVLFNVETFKCLNCQEIQSVVIKPKKGVS